MRYFFDIRKGRQVITDDVGIEFDSLEEAQEAALIALAEAYRDETARHNGDGVAHSLTLEVRDENGPLLEVRFELDTGGHIH